MTSETFPSPRLCRLSLWHCPHHSNNSHILWLEHSVGKKPNKSPVGFELMTSVHATFFLSLIMLPFSSWCYFSDVWFELVRAPAQPGSPDRPAAPGRLHQLLALSRNRKWLVLFPQPTPEPVQAGIAERDDGVDVDDAAAVLLLVVASQLLDVEGLEALQLAVDGHRQETFERRQVDGEPVDDDVVG